MEDDFKILVIGASMGGLRVFEQVVSFLSPDMPVAVFMVQHTFPEYRSMLDKLLARHTSMKVANAADNATIEPGHIYVCPADRHIVIKEGFIKVICGKPENGARPSINVMFRSAAVAYSTRVIGLLMTGLLSDGVNGLKAIRDCGGVTIVQDPEDAEYEDMPSNAIKQMDVDYIANVQDLAVLFRLLMTKKSKSSVKMPESLLKMVSASEQDDYEIIDIIENKALTDTKSLQQIESSLYATLSLLQERCNMLESLFEKEMIQGRTMLAKRYYEKMMFTKEDVKNIHKLLNEYEIVKK